MALFRVGGSAGSGISKYFSTAKIANDTTMSTIYDNGSGVARIAQATSSVSDLVNMTYESSSFITTLTLKVNAHVSGFNGSTVIDEDKNAGSTITLANANAANIFVYI